MEYYTVKQLLNRLFPEDDIPDYLIDYQEKRATEVYLVFDYIIDKDPKQEDIVNLIKKCDSLQESHKKYYNMYYNLEYKIRNRMF